MAGKYIVVDNAHHNNLKHLDLRIPHGRLTVVTGVSGSGKSSLAFDTIYAEGQRRYVETFSPYARQFLDRMDKPKVDRIEGIPPAIAIDQTNPVRTSRSTVGTMTELNDHIKLLYARFSTLYCDTCGEPVQHDSPHSILHQCIEQFDEGQRLMITFKVDVPAQFSGKEVEGWLARQGYTRIHERTVTRLEVIQDRLRLSGDNHGRLADALEAALKQGRGRLTVHALDADRNPFDSRQFSTERHCAGCDKSFAAPTPGMFSFNSPIGACEHCRGFGRVMGIDYNLVIPDQSLSLRDGAVKVWQSKTNAICQRDLVRNAGKAKVPLDVAWKSLSRKQQRWVIEGDQDEGGNWYGIQGFFDWLEGRAYKMHVRVMLSRYRAYEECPGCRGARLKDASLNWRIGSLEHASRVIDPAERFRPPGSQYSAAIMATLPGLCLHDLMRLPIDRCLVFIQSVAASLASNEAADMLFREMVSRLGFLCDVGTGYLTLDRQSRTLSGGEVQRINLTTALGTSLVNTLFVLDEPSIGLHARDMDRIIGVLHRLRDNGNTLLIVEHDPQLMLAADQIIDMGPGPGQAGGEVIFQGSPAALLKRKRSLTAQYLAGTRSIAEIARPTQGKPSWLGIRGATEHNLDNLDVDLPLNRLVCITGPSGSGKSTLIHDVLYLGLRQQLGDAAGAPGKHRRLTGLKGVDAVTLVDQSAIGKSTRSNPVSYTGAFEEIRKLFAREPTALERGYTAGSFSFNAGMRCPVCSGNGFEHIEMQFLSDIYLRCSECNGSRYRHEVLDVKLFPDPMQAGLSIADVLQLTVDTALGFFSPWPKVLAALQPLKDVGLGYVQLGQPVPTLSGGESQRLKLAAHLAKASTSQSRHNLFLFDEPTTGLHFDDIDKLMQAFQQLLDAGHSVLVIEHNLDVILQSDWVVDLGPEGGEDGGTLVFAGAVKDLLDHADSHTGAALRQYRESLGNTRKAGKQGGVAEAPAASNYGAQTIPGNAITVQQAREHNLKNIDLSVPRDKLTVVTGMSGSGKSTLAFDILFNEGQRRYLESLNAYARQFVQPASRPDVDAIHGIPPTVAIEQRTSRGGRKSTVATMTELHHFLRLLFMRLGTQHCPDCNIPITDQPLEAVQAQIVKRWQTRTIRILAPLVVARKGYYTDLAKWASARGYETLRVDEEYLPTDAWPRLDRFREHDIDLPVADISVSTRSEAELLNALQRGLDHGKGLIRVQLLSAAGKPRGKDHLFSTIRACPHCQRSFPEPDPRLFSYNSAHGWCKRCFGTGELLQDFDEEQTGEEQGWINAGDSEAKTCPDCHGQRLNPVALAVRFRGRSIADIAALSVRRAEQTFGKLRLTGRDAEIARDILAELRNRLRFLNEVGLSYLTLDRSAPTLSGGEAQRIRLAAQLGSNLRGVCYILDEPTIGLHPRDNRRLLDTLKNLRARGNTIVVVEHDEETIREAEHLIDIGPGAGVNGGQVVAQGSIKALCRNPRSITGKMLKHGAQPHRYTPRAHRHGKLRVRGASINNLKKLNVDIPLQTLTCVAGVSGSGKSTLVRRVLHDNLRPLNGQRRRRKLGKLTGCDSLDGWESIQRVLEVDQTPIGKTPRSCPATYIGFWDRIRALFADTTEARIRGFTASRFSFNVRGGRCDLCDGQGYQRVEMNFLPDVKVPCERCEGARFNSETLAVQYREQSIGDVLAMSVDDAVVFFNAHSSIHHPLKLLQDVGLGYLTLGQPSPTLSGGEAQRIKLVAELAKAGPAPLKPSPPKTGTKRKAQPGTVRTVHTLYLLDEPTVGLHMADVQRLVDVLQRLVDAGNSIVVIEHNVDLMANADWIIDMGPEGGGGGGRIVARGTPARLAESRRSQTAPWLAERLQNNN